MREDSFFRLVQRLRKAYCGRSSGSSLLWAIGSLVVIGVLGAAMALMTPSTMQSKLEQEAGMRAYYNANAGLNFLLTMHNVAQRQKISFSDYMTAMGGSTLTTYGVGNNGYFTYQLGSIGFNGNNGNYRIVNLYGTVTNAAGGEAYAYAIYGGGKGNSSLFSYVPKGSGTNTPQKAAKYVIYGGGANVVIGGSANITGDVTAANLDVEQANIVGNVISKGVADLGYLTNIQGYLCSGGDVTLDQSTVSGAINANGDIIFKYNSNAYGDVFSNGYVTTAEAVNIYGDLNADSYITSSGRANMFQDVFSGSDITLSGNPIVISSNAYADDRISMAWGTSILGTAVAASIKQKSGSSIGNKTITTTYPPNIRPTPAATCTYDDAPPNATIVPGVTNITIGWNDTRYDRSSPLAPGNYNMLTLSSSSPITFESGVYNFNSVTLGWGSVINYNIVNGDIAIFVKNDIDINATNGINVTKDGTTWPGMDDVVSAKAAAPAIYWETHGTGKLEWGVPWLGTLYSNVAISLGGQDDPVIGELATSGTISQIDWSTNIIYVPSNYAMEHWY